MTGKFPSGSSVRGFVAIPEGGGRLVVEDSDGNELQSWTLEEIYDDYKNPIPGAKYMIAASPAAIDEPVSTPEGGGSGRERGTPKGGTP